MKHTNLAVIALIGAIGCEAEAPEQQAGNQVEFDREFLEKLGQDQSGLLARLPIGPRHAFEIYESRDQTAISYVERGAPGTRPSALLDARVLDSLSPRDVHELLAPGRPLPAALAKYPRTNGPRPTLNAELVQQANIANEKNSNQAANGPCPWEFFRDTTTSLGPLCIPQGTPYEDAKCWMNASWADVYKGKNKRAMAAICPVSDWKTFHVFVNHFDSTDPDYRYIVGPGWWVQHRVTGSCRPFPSVTCDTPIVMFKMLQSAGTAHFSYGYDGWPGG